MNCIRCNAYTTNKNAIYCPRPGCPGRLEPVPTGFTILRYKSRPKRKKEKA